MKNKTSFWILFGLIVLLFFIAFQWLDQAHADEYSAAANARMKEHDVAAGKSPEPRVSHTVTVEVQNPTADQIEEYQAARARQQQVDQTDALDQDEELADKQHQAVESEIKTEKEKHPAPRTSPRGVYLKEVYEDGFNAGYRKGLEMVERSLDVLCPLGR